MNTRLLLLPVAFCALSLARAEDKPAEPSPKPAGSAEVFDPKALAVLREKKGQILTVEGTIVRVGESKTGTHRYLNFTNNFRESISLVFPIAKNPDEFKFDKVKEWVGKKVRATGTVSEYGSDLQMIIEKWDQLVEVK